MYLSSQQPNKVSTTDIHIPLIHSIVISLIPWQLKYIDNLLCAPSLRKLAFRFTKHFVLLQEAAENDDEECGL